MRLLLPDAADGIQALEKEITPELIGKIAEQLDMHHVNAVIPKFHLKDSIDLKEILQKMGMIDAFNGAANFSGISGIKNLALDKAVHKTFITVDERGTEAAAATAISINLTALPPGETVTFRADHAFIFMIMDKASETILFIGRVF